MMQNQSRITRPDDEKIETRIGKHTLVNIALVLVIGLYEIHTGAFLSFFRPNEKVNMQTESSQLEVNRTKLEEHFCDRKVRLASYDQLPIVYLNSFPGSGNTWTRQLIEDATGYYSGSIYSEGTMVTNGFIGEFDDPTSGRTIVIKNHGQNKMEYADGIIYVVRNPYNAIIADYNRQTSHSHTGSVDYSKFSGDEWDAFVAQHTSRWGNSHLWYPTFAKLMKVPLMIIYYEDLKIDVVPQMKRVVEYFENNFNLTFEDQEWRIQCLLEMQGKFYRQKKPLKRELYSKDQIELIDASIRKVQIMFDMFDLPPISDDYYKNQKNLRETTYDEVEEYINGGKITGKINDRLEARQLYEKNEKSPRQYYPFNPFKY